MSAGGEAPGEPPSKRQRVDDDGDLREALRHAQEEIRKKDEALRREREDARRELEEAVRREREGAQRAREDARRELEEAVRREREGAQRAREDVQREAEEALRREREGAQRAIRQVRLIQLQTITARKLPNIIPPTAGGAGGGSRSGTPTADLAADVVVQHAGDAAVDALLPPAGDPMAEERVCRELESLLRQREALPTPTAANEVEFWQRYIVMVLEALRRIAQRDGLAMLKAHHDEPSSSSRERRPDFAFTLPNEHHPHYSTTCFVMEVKPHKRSGQSRASLIREAAAQCISHLAARQTLCDDLPQTGYALATAGVELCIVRIDFSEPTVPVHLSRELPFLPTAAFRPLGAGEDPQAPWDGVFASPLSVTTPGPSNAGAGAGSGAARDAGDNSGAPAAAPPILPGLRALVRLALTHDLSTFGLGRIAAMPPPEGAYAAGELLGEGGYANVMVWRHAATGEGVAAKYLRVPSDRDGGESPIKREAGILAALEVAGVPCVPRLALPPGAAAGAPRTVTAQDGRHVLLSRPIGEPLRRHVAPLPDAERAAAAAEMGQQLWDTLTRAHAAGYQHGDVRPGNIVRVAGAPGGGAPAAVDWLTPDPSWMLIDWGLGERVPADPRPSTKMRGEMAFLSDRRLRILAGAAASPWAPTPQDDLDAAMLTFLALAGGSDCGASWPRGALVTPVNVLEERWALSLSAKRRPAVDAAMALLPPGSALRSAVEAYMAAPPRL